MFTVVYKGLFGFIKPWTAVRDGETYSQQFLTPSIIEGIEKKLFPSMLHEKGIKKIVRHKLSFSSIDLQAETTQTRGYTKIPNTNLLTRGTYKNGNINFTPLKRGVLLHPVLHLAFSNREDAEIAFEQHICLCRNEDILLPEIILEMDEKQFNSVEGFELRFGTSDHSFLAGYNRFDDNKPMYGWIEYNGISL